MTIPIDIKKAFIISMRATQPHAKRCLYFENIDISSVSFSRCSLIPTDVDRSNSEIIYIADLYK